MTATGSGGQPSGTEDDQRSNKREDHKETFRIIKEMSDVLNTGLDSESLGVCLRLCEDGVNPVALAHLIKDWRRNKKDKGEGHGLNGNNTQQ